MHQNVLASWFSFWRLHQNTPTIPGGKQTALYSLFELHPSAPWVPHAALNLVRDTAMFWPRSQRHPLRNIQRIVPVLECGYSLKELVRDEDKCLTMSLEDPSLLSVKISGTHKASAFGHWHDLLGFWKHRPFLYLFWPKHWQRRPSPRCSSTPACFHIT